MATYTINKTATYLQVIADGREYVTDNDTTFALEGGDSADQIEFSYQNAGRGNVIQPVNLASDTFTLNGTAYGAGQRDAVLAAYRNSIVSNSPATQVTQAFTPAGELAIAGTEMVISRNFIAGITNQDWSTLTTGLGSVSHNNNANTALLSADGTDRAVLQSKAHTGILYGAQWVGKMTINTGTTTSNVQMRIGWFDDAGDKSVGGDQLKGDGIYLEFVNGVILLVQRSSTSGVTKSNVIASGQWDDPLDGTGASGITLAVNTYYTWVIKIPADGTGMLVLSVIAQDGNTYEVHRTPLQIVFVPDPVSPVFRSNSLPFRAEVEGLGSNSGSLAVKSFSVQSQGLGDVDYPSFPIGRDTTTIQPDGTNYMPVLLVRRSATFGERLNMLLDEIAATLQSTADRVHLIYYRVDPTDFAAWAGTLPTWNPAGNANSGLEFAIDTGGITLPVQLTNSDKLPPEHYVTPNSDAFAIATWQENISGQDIAGNSDIIAVFAKRVVGTGSAPNLLVAAEIKSW